jgi:hypothetical protein
MMLTVSLTMEEWQRVWSCMSCAPWRDVNQLLMKMGEQVQKQAPNHPTTNSVEMPINIGQNAVKQ